MLDHVPANLKETPQWIIWRYEPKPGKIKPTKVPLTLNNTPADVTNPANWLTFDVATEMWRRYPALISGVGIALGGPRRLGGLDIDGCIVNGIIRPDAVKLLQMFNTYTEYSPSGEGVHALFYADPAPGIKRDELEIYTDKRFFTVTGNIVQHSPTQLRDCTDEAGELMRRMALAKEPTYIPDQSVQSTISDDEIVARLRAQVNGDDFATLYDTADASAYNNDDSSADQALMNYFAQHSDSTFQIANLFRGSARGLRPKVTERADYIPRTIRAAFNRKVPMATGVLSITHQVANYVAPEPELVEQIPDPVNVAKASAVFAPPPGLVGEIAKYVYNQAYRPMPEAAIIAALTLMAGICGRQYQCRGKGLNLYFMLLAQTGAGKDQMAQGIGKIMKAVTAPPTTIVRVGEPAPMGFEAAKEFIGPARNTGNGVMKELANRSMHSMCSILGEFADTMRQLADPKANQGIRDFKTQLLMLYNHSTEGNDYQGYKAGTRDGSIPPIASPSYSFASEGTPDHMYSNISPDMIRDGLLPRIIIVEHMGYPQKNLHHVENSAVPDGLRDWVSNLCKHVITLKTGADARCEVQWDADALAFSEKYSDECFAKVVGSTAEAGKQLWNRAHNNVERIAALVAIGVNGPSPRITLANIQWAAAIVTRQVDVLMAKFNAGDIGSTGPKLEDQFAGILVGMRAFLAHSPATLPKSLQLDKASRTAIAHNAVPLRYLQQSTSSRAGFEATGNRDKQAVLQAVLDAACNQGVIRQVRLPDHSGRFYDIVL